MRSGSRFNNTLIVVAAGALLTLAFVSGANAWEWGDDKAAFDLNGYYKNLLTVSDTHDFYKDLDLANKRYFVDDYNRLRIKSLFRTGDVFSIVAHYELFISSGDTIWTQYRAQQEVKQLVQQFGPVAEQAAEGIMSFITADDIPRFMDMQEELPLRGGQRMAHGIDRLFFRLNVPYFSAEAGRMALSWGTGRIWNPTDMWSPFSPTEIDKDEKQGVDLVHLTFDIPKIGALEGVFAPLDMEDHYSYEQDDSSAGGRLRFNIGEYDISVMGGAFGPDTVAGLDFTGYIKNAGFRGEATYTFVDPDDDEPDYLRAVLSVDYGFAAFGNPYLLVEAFFNGLGETDPDKYLERMQDNSVQRMMAMGRAFSFGRDYLAIMGTFQPHPLVTLSLQPIMNIDDQSAFIGFTTKYAVTDWAEIIGGVNVFAGPDKSEFGGLELKEAGLDTTYRASDLYYLYLKAYF